MSDDYKNRDKDSGGAEVGSWIFIALMFVVWWPIGLFFLIRKLKEDDPNAAARREERRAKAAAAKQKTVKPKKSITSSPKDTNPTARVLKIVGGILTALGGIACLGVLSELGMYLDYGSVWWLLEDLFPCLGLLAGGIAMLQGGRYMTRRMRRFSKYLAAAGNRTVVPLGYLADAAEVPEKRVRRDLEMMIEQGLWGKGAFVDLGTGRLFRSQEAAEEFYQQQGEAVTYYYTREEKKVTPPQAADGYAAVLQRLRRADERIMDEELSAKIVRLESIARRIFRLLEQEPEKKAKANTFLNYYLPTTQKLLDSYAEFEEAGINGDNLTEAKRKIEDIMENIVRGFEHQLDELYRSDTMDIDRDIRVMKTMLHRDSNTAEKDFGLGGGTAAAAQGEEQGI